MLSLFKARGLPSHLIETLPANTNHAVKAQHWKMLGAFVRQESLDLLKFTR